MANQYEIRLKGHLSSQWASYFEGFKLVLGENGETVLTGEVIDQSALHGLLDRIRDLGLPLLAVNLLQNEKGRGSGPAQTETENEN
ncbi:MAG: hypothetical protein J0I20_23140 [Chloroflexi bacterium]|nr:hypothetical protein [Chloroflexota bacterium]OJV92135.1 MAG: hypothetical protein BGO39_09450 [Chloroflexi bacterium 54-19]